MKKILFISLLLMSFSAIAQTGLIRELQGSAPGFKKYKDTLKSLNVVEPLYKLDDSTIAAHRSFTVSKNATRDSIIFLFFDGTRTAIKDSIGSGSGGGMAIGGSITSSTAKSILYVGTGGVLMQSNSGFSYDSATASVGIGTASPTQAIHVVKNTNTGERLFIVNTNTGGSAQALVHASNGTSSFQAGVFGTGFTTSGLNIAGAVYFQSNSASRFILKSIQAGAFTAPPIIFAMNASGIDTEVWRMDFTTGNLSNTGAAGTAGIHLKAGVAAAGGAPLKLTITGAARLTSFERGAIEAQGNRLYYSDSTLRYIIHSGGTPTIAAGTGAGTSPTISISGIDECGYISVTTGTGCATSATLATITFSSAYSASALRSVIITPANSAAALLTGVTQVFADQSAVTGSAFTITTGTTALTDATTYKFYYRVHQ